MTLSIRHVTCTSKMHVSHDMTKPTKWLCAPWRLRSAWASAKTLIRLGGCPGWSDLCWAHSHFVGFVISRLICSDWQVFDNITSKCGIKGDLGSLSPQMLDSLKRKETSLVTMETTEFKDIVLYLADIGLTLKSFLEVYPPACQAFHDNEFIPR